ncbi:PREDICTED: cell surface glycoprotein CD200 receptor 1-like [Elephantulus edwardii]|uniref:cell surface glycoprotein CD200 receptor 1-like n=1 Tax=Elephantulus edwardii TaxID=28737 RepID=UPI0003F0726C|nr:PREDICTED: cell surface glycoprotein CD200 receptor 1-like [Elephantulus edwardii]
MFWLQRTSVLGLLIVTISLVSGGRQYQGEKMERRTGPGYLIVPTSRKDKRDEKHFSKSRECISLTVLEDTKTILSCHPVPQNTFLLATWKIFFRDNTSCTRAYRNDTNKTIDTNCADERITWASRPDHNPDLQIDPVAITHDGCYTCEIVSRNGNFHRYYHLQVTVPPKESISLIANRTVLCKAVGGRPAAQIYWSPEGNCSTEQQDQGDGAVSVQSECNWMGHDVSIVTCFVSHSTGNKSLSLKLHPGYRPTGSIHFVPFFVPCITFSIITLIIMLPVCYLKRCGCSYQVLLGRLKIQIFGGRWSVQVASPAQPADEMHPYASYTEKNNPVYDDARKMKTSKML